MVANSTPSIATALSQRIAAQSGLTRGLVSGWVGEWVAYWRNRGRGVRSAVERDDRLDATGSENGLWRYGLT